MKEGVFSSHGMAVALAFSALGAWLAGWLDGCGCLLLLPCLALPGLALPCLALSLP
jgi:hypothetical protein